MTFAYVDSKLNFGLLWLAIIKEDPHQVAKLAEFGSSYGTNRRD